MVHSRWSGNHVSTCPLPLGAALRHRRDNGLRARSARPLGDPPGYQRNRTAAAAIRPSPSLIGAGHAQRYGPGLPALGRYAPRSRVGEPADALSRSHSLSDERRRACLLPSWCCRSLRSWRLPPATAKRATTSGPMRPRTRPPQRTPPTRRTKTPRNRPRPRLAETIAAVRLMASA